MQSASWELVFLAAQEARVVAAGRDWKGVLSVRVTEDCPVASLSCGMPSL